MSKKEQGRGVSETEKQSLIISRGRLMQGWKALNSFPRIAYSTHTKKRRIKRFKNKEQRDTDGSQGTPGSDNDLHKWLNLLG